MEIYIKIEPKDECAYGNGWYVDETESGCGSFINDGNDLEGVDKFGNYVIRGSAAKSWREAKTWAKVARMMTDWDYGPCRITFWSWRRGKLVKVVAPKKKVSDHKA